MLLDCWGSVLVPVLRTPAITAKALAMVELFDIIILLSCPRSGTDLVVSQVGWAGWEDKSLVHRERERAIE